MKPRTFCLAIAGAVLLMPPPASARTIAFDTDEVTEAAVAISPDGSKIVFVSDRGAREWSEFGIYLLDSSTKKVSQLTRESFRTMRSHSQAG